MAEKKSGLGSGLDAIFGRDFTDLDDLTNNSTSQDQSEIELDKIQANPYQPRKTFNQEELEELADSIREHGVFQPIIVKKLDSNYVLLAGERRVRAAKLAGLTTIPAIVGDFTDQQMMELSLLENIQREDLSVIEEAQSYQTLIDNLGYTQEKLAQRLGKSRSHITNTLRLLSLPDEVKEMVNNKELTMGQVRPLITIDNKEQQIKLANTIKNRDLSSRQAEMLAKGLNTPKVTKQTKQNPDILAVQKKLQSKLGTKVRIKNQEIKIQYKDVSDLNRILEILDCLQD